MKSINVPGFPPARGAYCHGVHVQSGELETLFVSGQVAMDDNGSIPIGIEAQTDLVLKKIERVLAAAGFGMPDVAKMTTYLTSASDIAGFSRVRNDVLADLRPAATLVIVQALANPDFLVEIEAIAVRQKSGLVSRPVQSRA